jgi:predicted transposase YdaD
VVLDTGALPEAAGKLAEAARTQPDALPLLDLIETILVYKLPNLSRDEIKAMLNLPDTDLKQTRFYREVFAEGREEGREEAQRRTALNLLRQTDLDDQAIAQATGLDADKVRALRQSSGLA